MNAARDELAALIEHAILQRDEWTQSEAEAAADAILAAGAASVCDAANRSPSR